MKYAKPRKYKHTSRYQIYRQIVDDYGDTYVETVNRTPVEASQKDTYHTVQQNEENRLDIIAKKYYGDAQYYWIIALANDLVDPLVIKVGDILRIPPFVSLTKWRGALYGRV